ncbi:single-stranded DNA-binding protein [Mycetocola zhadangensis]|uniref:single-stranded DNA-binding protein n=1 Tax=Mycetocola zhadangensis TaxID=1164595 RepID=UPI003A4E3A63
MTDSISLSGIVATVPEHRRLRDDLELVSFRLASSQRYFDRNSRLWVTGDTNWYTISTFRHLATNVLTSVHKGDRVLVIGRLRIRRWENGEKTGIAVEVDAETVGHDLAWGTAQYVRTPAKEPVRAAEPSPDVSPHVDEYAAPTSSDTGRDSAAGGDGPEPISAPWNVTALGVRSDDFGAGGDRDDSDGSSELASVRQESQ